MPDPTAIIKAGKVAGNVTKLETKAISAERYGQMIEALQKDVSDGKLTFEQYRERSEPLIKAKVAAELRTKSGEASKTLADIFPGMKSIKPGTKILGTHGTAYTEPTQGIVTGSKQVKTPEGWVNAPIVDFGDGRPRTVLPYDIKDVLAPKLIQGGKDISRGFNIKLPTSNPYIANNKIPFKPGTDIEKAKAWSRNFLRSKDEFKVLAASDDPANFRSFSELVDTKNEANKIRFINLEDAYQIRTSEVAKEAKGQGIGAGMYRALFETAEAQGKSVRSDSKLTSDSYAVWKRLKELGYPIKERPHKQIDKNHFELTDKDAYKTVEEQGGIFEFIPTGAKNAKDFQ